MILVCDNLNTHTKGAFYEAFPARPGARSWFAASSSVTRPSMAVG